MKTKIFDSFDKYEEWTEQFENASDYQEIPVAIDKIPSRWAVKPGERRKK